MRLLFESPVSWSKKILNFFFLNFYFLFLLRRTTFSELYLMYQQFLPSDLKFIEYIYKWTLKLQSTSFSIISLHPFNKSSAVTN
uniref:Ovule protein n=1 Tax=Heterorhabditis bacteriophora TaxID=37862 RepID=A0A1I7X2F4_HETBA